MKQGTKLIIVILIAILGLAAYSYVFKVYETKVETTTTVLFADNNSTVEIYSIPVDALGWRAPFRKVKTQFEVREGRDLVDIVSEDDPAGKLVLRAKDKTGKVSIYVKPALALLPTLVEINILPNLALK